MEATKERAARRNRATHARTSDSQPAHGSRPKSITHRRRRAKYQIRRLLAVLVLVMVGAALWICMASLFAPDAPAVTDIPQDPQTTADSGLFYGEVTDPTFTAYLYAPARTTSNWHESQIFVIELGGHRFFKERSPEK